MVSTHLEKIFYHYVLESRELINVVKPRFFETDAIRKCYTISQEFFERYGQTPTKRQMEEVIKSKGESSILENDKLEVLYDVRLDEYDKDWLRESAESWIEYKNLDISVVDLISYLKTTKVNSENVKEVVATAKGIITDRNNIQFGFDEGLDFFNPESHKQPTTDTFATGYPFIDLVTGGGFSLKTLMVFLGEAKIGKSIWLANMAANCVRNGYNTAVISLEMRDRKVVKRLGANLLNVKMKEYAALAEDQDVIKKKLKQIGFDNLQMPGQLFVKEFPTSAASVPDVEMWLRKMEELKGIKFKTIFIDYINILKNWRNANSENTYMKIKQIAEDLRAMAVRNSWAIITATQVNRSGFGSTDLSLTNVSESSGLIHTVDSMFGIIQDEIMHANLEYTLKLIANRDDGYKNARKKFLINYEMMRITEDANSQMITE